MTVDTHTAFETTARSLSARPNTAKRILIVTHEFPPMHGGISRYASELAEAASRLGHVVTVLAPDFGQDCSHIDMVRPFQVKRYSAGAYRSWELPRVLWRILTQVRPEAYDVIHAVDPSYVMALALARPFKRIPFQATVYGTDVLGLRTSLQATITGARRMFEAPTRLIAISQHTAGLLRQCSPRLPQDRIEIVAPGVNEAWFQDAGSAGNTLGISPGKYLLTTVSRLDSRKGHRTVLRGLAQLSPSWKAQIVYAIVGSGSDRHYISEIRRLAAVSGVDVQFTGDVSDEVLRQIYARSALFCMPGESDPKKVEGFGLVYLEAAAQRLPSIATSVGAAPEVVRHGKTGWLVPPSDPAAFADAVMGILPDERLRSEFGSAARSWAATFTWDRCARLVYGGVA